jgi:hypothetical protein
MAQILGAIEYRSFAPERLAFGDGGNAFSGAM